MSKPEFRINCPKLDFDLANAKAAIDGVFDDVLGEFVFEHSREGHSFWYDQYNAKELSPAGRKSLEEMIAMHEALGGAE